MDLKSKIILIYGPTASGKSKFALKLAQKIDGEIINADSMQVYKELKVLSARPQKEDINKNINLKFLFWTCCELLILKFARTLGDLFH